MEMLFSKVKGQTMWSSGVFTAEQPCSVHVELPKGKRGVRIMVRMPDSKEWALYWDDAELRSVAIFGTDLFLGRAEVVCPV